MNNSFLTLHQGIGIYLFEAFKLCISAAFYTLPCVSDFIVDILVGCSQSDIRSAAADQFFLLSQTEVPNLESSSNPQTPHHFLLQVLLKAYVPFWVSSSSTRGASQRYLHQEDIVNTTVDKLSWICNKLDTCWFLKCSDKHVSVFPCC